MRDPTEAAKAIIGYIMETILRLNGLRWKAETFLATLRETGEQAAGAVSNSGDTSKSGSKRSRAVVRASTEAAKTTGIGDEKEVGSSPPPVGKYFSGNSS